MFDDFSNIVGYIRKDKKGQTSKQERLETPSKQIVNDTTTKPRSRSAKNQFFRNPLTVIATIVALVLASSIIISFIYSSVNIRNNPPILISPVDLGLPSGTLWGDRNVGAMKESDFGDLFSWGETVTKTDYTTDSYSAETKPISKITSKNYDAAKAILGDEWSLPTEEQFNELIDCCEWKMTTMDGNFGIEFTGKNGNKLFFPAAGWNKSTTVEHRNEYGYYWTSERNSIDDRFARILLFSNDVKRSLGNGYLYYGRSIRAVYSSSDSHL